MKRTAHSPVQRRVHIAGSASTKTSFDLLGLAHDVVVNVVRGVLERGSGLVLAAGKEPRREDATDARGAVVFDWTALEAAHAAIASGGSAWKFKDQPPIILVMSEKAENDIPATRRTLWQDLLRSGAVAVHYIQAGSRAAALIRERQARLGDLLVVLGGGSGVEHLAELYTEARRSVIPIDLPLGASRADGLGGASRLAQLARAEPERFLQFRSEHYAIAGTLLARLSARNANSQAAEIAASVLAILDAVEHPKVFYARLLNAAHADFANVETFFREVVDPEVATFGYARIEMGTDASNRGFMNVEIFESLHYASAVVVDVTGLRPNCFIELGYALGREHRIIVTAQEGTVLPFDEQAIPTHFWSHSRIVSEQREQFRTFWTKNIDRDPLV
jgi:ATP nucleosidase Cap17-like protein